MKYRIKNWDRFQHYRQRNPPWIKLYSDLLSSSDWVLFDDASRVLAISCMLVASQTNGEIDGSPEGLVFLKRVAYLRKTPNLKPLIVSGFLVSASTLLADSFASNQVASGSNINILSPSVSGSSLSDLSEEGGVGGTQPPAQRLAKIPHGEFLNVFLTQEEFVKLGQRFGKALTGRIENLSQYIASKGVKYKSHYATLLQWAAREQGHPNGSPPHSPLSKAGQETKANMERLLVRLNATEKETSRE